MTRHHYIDRGTGNVVAEHLQADRFVQFLYGPLRERLPWLFRQLVSPRSTALLALLEFDAPTLLGRRAAWRCLKRWHVDLAECLRPAHGFRTPREVFERRIRYWECRPMASSPGAVVSPADARLLVGSLEPGSLLFVKQKHFALEDLLGHGKTRWHAAFAHGDYAILRLPPTAYHYNHTPVAGRVEDIYAVDGLCHSCNPLTTAAVAFPCSHNRRVVTVIQTDVPGGTGVGLVAMVEVVALMIGDVVQCYSQVGYHSPQAVVAGMFVARGAPKSRYRPGSSTDILLFEPGRVRFAADLVSNHNCDAAPSRYSLALRAPSVETKVRVRSQIATASVGQPAGGPP